MKDPKNIEEVAKLNPDYLGFIFYDRSPRNFEGIIPQLPKSIKKTGVFVDEIPEIVVSLAEEYQLAALQLHGDESVSYIKTIKEYLPKIEIIKVFSVSNSIDENQLKEYEAEVDYFLFDTKGKERGGNGVKFDWSALKNYSLPTPFFLSGGIGKNDTSAIQEIQKSGLPIHAIDINSQFELKPGFKNVKEISRFKKSL